MKTQIKTSNTGVFVFNGNEIVEDTDENREYIEKRFPKKPSSIEDIRNEGRGGTIAFGILSAHNASGSRTRAGDSLHLRYDAMTSHDITFVNIIQTAKVSGLEKFPIPYILTNCHNSLCAVGGTINEDDHVFGLSAAKKYGGIYVPPHLAVIHSYIRETHAGCGRMILGSDSHTRYGALGTMGVGEGGGELVKQLLNQTYDIDYPKVIAVYLSGKPMPGVGPQDIALAIIGAIFKNGYAKNAVLEFIGDGIGNLSADYRSGIDVMTTETTCWSSIWETDDTIRSYLKLHRREAAYKKLSPGESAYYDGLVRVELDKIKPMIALPFHPSNVFEIDELLEDPSDILREVERGAKDVLENPGIAFTLSDKADSRGRVRVDQGIIAGCAGGTFENIMAAEAILDTSGERLRDSENAQFSLSIYPGSQPVMLELARNGALGRLIAKGALIRSAFCGPCFGAGDVPANNGLSIRHTTRNFPNREGSMPVKGQIASVALMDARSIAATAANDGFLASALGIETGAADYRFDYAPYRSRVYNGTARPMAAEALQYGPNITDWPEIGELGENLLIKIVSYITDPVTTTDELIPSGETSSFRSNPMGLAEFTLSRKDPEYVGSAKLVKKAEAARLAEAAGGEAGPEKVLPELAGVLKEIMSIDGCGALGFSEIQIGSAIYAHKPGDGSAREQAASCQRVLGGMANFALEYATKRYRSNLINWGILPFTVMDNTEFARGDYVFIPNARDVLKEGQKSIQAHIIGNNGVKDIALNVPAMTPVEKEIVRDGCLINYNRRMLKHGGQKP